MNFTLNYFCEIKVIILFYFIFLQKNEKSLLNIYLSKIFSNHKF